jgi:hypothetical protein
VVIRLCKAPVWRDTDLHARIATRRAPRGKSEIRVARDEIKVPNGRFDPRACRISVDFTVTASSDTWIIEASEGFECLSLRRLGEFSIEEICYTTAAERDRANRARKQCQDNQQSFPEFSPLRSGRYYRLRVKTSVTGELNQQAFPPNNPLIDVAVQLYEEALDALGLYDHSKTYEQVGFFQTDKPPTRIEPYIHWTNPALQADRVFREDDFAIRFRRAYVDGMYSPQTFPLELVLRGADANLVPAGRYTNEWSTDVSATLFPDEEVWDTQRGQVNLLNRSGFAGGWLV